MMTEIALMEVEDFERMKKRSAEKDQGCDERYSSVISAASLSNGLLAVGEKTKEELPHHIKGRLVGPRSTLGLAACDGFFSA